MATTIRCENSLKLTREEALLIIENLPGRRKFYAHVEVRIVNDEPEQLAKRNSIASLKLTQTQAVQLVRSLLLDDMEREGDRIPIRVIKYDGDSQTNGYTAIWIG